MLFSSVLKERRFLFLFEKRVILTKKEGVGSGGCRKTDVCQDWRATNKRNYTLTKGGEGGFD